MVDNKKPFEGLIKAARMSADELAAKKGEGDTFVKIKRNRERAAACDRHEFEPISDWRTQRGGLLYGLKVHCSRCHADLPADEAMHYLRGFAHGSGQNYDELLDKVLPK